MDFFYHEIWGASGSNFPVNEKSNEFTIKPLPRCSMVLEYESQHLPEQNHPVFVGLYIPAPWFASGLPSGNLT